MSASSSCTLDLALTITTHCRRRDLVTMDLGLDGRTALVCASTKGLGRATAEALAAEGVAVAINGSDAARVEEVAQGVPGAIAAPGDMTSIDGARAVCSAAQEALGGLDIVVLNGPGPGPGPAADLTGDDAHAAAERLVGPQVELVSRVVPGMRARGWGRIIAVSSSAVQAPIAGLALSNLGRPALLGYLKTLASEVARDGVCVNAVLPGEFSTDRVSAIYEDLAEKRGVPVEEVHRGALAEIPAGRYGKPEEFGALVAYLASTHAAFITGTTVRADGGMLPTL